MRGVISSGTKATSDLIDAARRSPSMSGLNLVEKVSTTEEYEWTKGIEPVSTSDKRASQEEPAFNVVAYDFGIKRNILRMLVHLGSPRHGCSGRIQRPKTSLR